MASQGTKRRGILVVDDEPAIEESNILTFNLKAGIVSDALKFVTQKQEQINTLQKLDERIETIEGEVEETTTNGVF